MNRNGAMQEAVVCDACRLVPVSHLRLDLEAPIGGWPAFFAKRGIELESDNLGRPSVPRHVLGELLSERREHEARRAERPLPIPPPVGSGIPMPEGADLSMTAFEVMRGADAEAEEADPNRRVSPTEEILTERVGRPRRVEVKEARK